MTLRRVPSAVTAITRRTLALDAARDGWIAQIDVCSGPNIEDYIRETLWQRLTHSEPVGQARRMKTAAPKDRRLLQHEGRTTQAASFLRRRAKPRPARPRPNRVRVAGSGMVWPPDPISTPWS